MEKLCTNKNHSYKHNEQINKQNIDNFERFGVKVVKIYPEMTSKYFFQKIWLIEISKQVVSNEERFLCASYLNPASLLNITPEIVDRLCNAYQRDLPRKKILCMRLSVGKSGGLL